MKILPIILALTLPASQTFAATDTLDASHVPIPLSTGWVEGFLLLIVWLFVVAIIIGPLITYFNLEPRSTQLFSDDRKIRS